MIGFTKVNWSVAQLEAFCLKHGLYEAGGRPFCYTEYQKQGGWPLVHAVHTTTNHPDGAGLWLNDEILWGAVMQSPTQGSANNG